MKNTISTLFIALVVLSVTACTGPARLPEGAVGRIDTLQGFPRLLRTEGYLELGPGAPVDARDVLFTETDERIKLWFPDKVMLEIGDNTQLGIHEYSELAQRFSLGYGLIRVELPERPRQQGEPSLQMFTSAGLVRVRGGSVLIGEFGEATGVSVILMTRGFAEVSNDFGTVILDEPGRFTRLEFAASPATPETFTQTAIDALYRLVAVAENTGS